ncbi:MAG: type II toxin-antitoxin system HicB family antitoxin [Magnetococcales bacterium]|nr:type II toxin-antitoxin system HicB family antitoxin [Magnetococcales bacterium]
MTTRYEIIMYWSDEDQSFIAEAPELPGCMADGPTRQQAMEKIEQIMEEWIETATSLGRAIPEPKGVTVHPPLTKLAC